MRLNTAFVEIDSLLIGWQRAETNRQQQQQELKATYGCRTVVDRSELGGTNWGAQLAVRAGEIEAELRRRGAEEYGNAIAAWAKVRRSARGFDLQYVKPLVRAAVNSTLTAERERRRSRVS